MEEFFSTALAQFRQIGFLEWFGVVTGALCVYLAARENILNWPISILSILSYIYIFYEAKLYGDTILQFYFLFTAVYGWYYWTYGQRKGQLKSERPVSRLDHKGWLIVLAVITVMGFVAAQLLDRFTDTDVPWLDGYCTVTSFVAQYLMTRKKLENWLIWIVVDIVYIPLYIHKELMATAVLYFVFTLIAAKGWRDWKRSFDSRKPATELD